VCVCVRVKGTLSVCERKKEYEGGEILRGRESAIQGRKEREMSLLSSHSW
jgi:hypothetical protein